MGRGRILRVDIFERGEGEQDGIRSEALKDVQDLRGNYKISGIYCLSKDREAAAVASRVPSNS